MAEPGPGLAASAPGAGLRSGLAAALVAGAVLVAYATSFAGGFQFDDWNVIVEAPRVQSLAAWWASLPTIRPLLKLTFAANLQSGLGLAGFHLVNLAIHAAAALLALWLVAAVERAAPPAAASRAAATPAPSTPAAAAGRTPAAAVAAALLFALHPVQTEAVTYLSGRSASLAGLLALASAAAWLAGRARGRAALVHALSPLLLLAALLAKETAVALPAALLLLGAATGGGGRRALRDTAVHWLLLAAAAAAYAASPTYRALAAHAAALRPPGQNLLAHLDGLGWLAGQVARPWALAADPAWPAWPASGALTARGAAALGLLLGLAGLAWRDLRLGGPAAPPPPSEARRVPPGQRPLAEGFRFTLGRLRRSGGGLRLGPTGAAALWTLCWLPATGWLLPRPEPASDRQLYLALLGPAWLAGRWLAAALRTRWRRPALGLAAALAVSLGGLTAARNLVYRDEVTYWLDAVATAPGAARPLNNLGLALSAACRLEEAEAAFLAALAADPGHPRARVNLWLLRSGSPPGARRGEVARCPPDGR